MTPGEQAILFPCAEDQLLGIVSPAERASAIGVVIVVGGPQYRVGSHRQFLLLARYLAANGFSSLRFDYRGMGDSSGEQQDFESASPDIAAAIDAFQRTCPEVRQVVLWGLCDAASAALLYWHDTRDHRVTGLCLLNPWVRSEATLARTQIKHYYGQRLMQREFWIKLVSGRLAIGQSVGGLFQKLCLSFRSAPPPPAQRLRFQDRMAEALADFDRAILLILSGNDHTAKEFLEYASATPSLLSALGRPNVERADVTDADHTFSTADWRGQAERLTLNWLQKIRIPS